MSFEVRAVDYSRLDSLPYAEAVKRAIRGEVEGVASASGKIKYLRVLPESEREPAPEAAEMALAVGEKRAKESASSVVARTNLGVYRQEIESARMDEYGIPTRIIIGHQWAFCALRGAGL